MHLLLDLPQAKIMAVTLRLMSHAGLLASAGIGFETSVLVSRIDCTVGNCKTQFSDIFDILHLLLLM